MPHRRAREKAKGKGCHHCCKNPVSFITILLAMIAAVYGLWNHDWAFIIGAVVLKILGIAYFHATMKK